MRAVNQHSTFSSYARETLARQGYDILLSALPEYIRPFPMASYTNDPLNARYGMMRKNGLSIIEVLIIVCVLVVLAMLLLPVFRHESIPQMRCMSHQKQIVTATCIYAQEHHDTLPNERDFWTTIGLPAITLHCEQACQSSATASRTDGSTTRYACAASSSNVRPGAQRRLARLRYSV